VIGGQNSKLEIRISKQIQMTKKYNVPNNPDSAFSFWIIGLRLVLDFEIRISDLVR